MTLHPLALLAGLLVAAPTLWAALVEGTLPPGVALTRTLLVLLVCTVVGGAVEPLLRAYTAGQHVGPRRRREDRVAGGPGSGPPPA